MINDYITFKGTDADLTTFLSEFFPLDQIQLVRSTLPLLKSSLNEFETIEKTREETDIDGSGFNLIVLDNYYINIRKTTLALFALVMDIAYADGFATFIFETFGISSHKFRKLSFDEKQIILLINAEKIIVDTNTDMYEINDERDYGYSSEKIKSIIDKLVEDDVVIRKEGSLKIAF